MKKIIAVVGMSGSGKSLAVDYLIKKGYKNIRFGAITYEKMEEENIPFSVENEKKMREGLRDKYGMAAYALLSIPKIKEYHQDFDVVIDGLYSWDELKVLEKEFDTPIAVIAIVTDKPLRYERVCQRNDGRKYDLEGIVKRDISELENLDKGSPIAYADYFILNNGSPEDLEKRCDEILETIKKLPA